MLTRVQQASTPRKALVVHSVESQQTVPKTAQILESRNRQARIDGDLALSRQTLCDVLHQSLLKEDKASDRSPGGQGFVHLRASHWPVRKARNGHVESEASLGPAGRRVCVLESALPALLGKRPI